jgi:hypothetical protein
MVHPTDKIKNYLFLAISPKIYGIIKKYQNCNNNNKKYCSKA